MTPCKLFNACRLWPPTVPRDGPMPAQCTSSKASGTSAFRCSRRQSSGSRKRLTIPTWQPLIFIWGAIRKRPQPRNRRFRCRPRTLGFSRISGDAYRWSGQKEKAAATYGAAISLAYKLVQVNPKDTDALANLANCYAKTGDSKQALVFIARARTIDPNDNVLAYDEGIINVLAGKSAQGLASIEQALQNGYSEEQVLADPELLPLREKLRALAVNKGEKPTTK